MCEISQHPHQFRRRSSSISLTVFQWTGSTNRDSGIGSSGSLSSLGGGVIPSGRNLDGSDSLANGESHATSSAIDIRRASQSDVVDFRARTYVLRGRKTSGSSLESLSRSIGTQTPTDDGIFAFPADPGFHLAFDEVSGGGSEDVADESAPLAPFNGHLDNARDRGRPQISRSISDSGYFVSTVRMSRAEDSEAEPNYLQWNPLIQGILSRRRNLPDLLTALPSSAPSNGTRSNSIPVQGPSSSYGRRHSVSFAENDPESISIGQQLRSIGDDLDRELSSGTSVASRFFGRSRSLSMVSGFFGF